MPDLRSFWSWSARVVLILVLVGIYLPLVVVALHSFNESATSSVWGGFSTRWYEQLLGRRDLWEGLRASVVVGVSASTLSVVLGTMAALGLRRRTQRVRRALSGLMFLPLVVPDIMIAISLALFFNVLGLPRGMTTVVAAHASFGVSYAFVVMSAAVGDLDDTLYLAALDLGATPRQAFAKVVVPILLPSLITAWLLVFAMSFDDFLIAFFTKGPGNDTLPIKIYSRMRFGVKPDTNALFVLLFLATLPFVLAAGRRGVESGKAVNG